MLFPSRLVNCRVVFVCVSAAVFLFVSRLSAQVSHSNIPKAISTDAIYSKYRKALAAYNSANPTAATDASAYRLFSEILTDTGAKRGNAKLCFNVAWRLGVLLDVRKKYDSAKSYYQEATRIASSISGWGDSAVFQVYLYLAADLYQEGNYDSALQMLNVAERIATRYKHLPEKERLYNTLGVLYYVTGNYFQAQDYFARAFNSSSNTKNNEDRLALQNNIASCLSELGRYDEAVKIYRFLIKRSPPTSEMMINIGRCYASEGKTDSAMNFFRMISPAKRPEVLNEMGLAMYLDRKYDSADYFLRQWQAAHPSAGPVQAGLNHLYRAQVDRETHRWDSCLLETQQAIILFSGNFQNADLRSNPVNFLGSVASLNLFTAIKSKAEAWKEKYKLSHQHENLVASWETYKCAVRLMRYLENTYQSDKAKFLLIKNQKSLVDSALVICLRLAGKGNSKYAEEAFDLIERSKATVVNSNRMGLSSDTIAGIDKETARKMRDTRFEISRLENAILTTNREDIRRQMTSQKADKELQISVMEKELEKNSFYNRSLFSDSAINVHNLRHCLAADEAMLSFYTTTDTLFVFCLTRGNLTIIRVDSLPMLTSHLTNWLAQISQVSKGYRQAPAPSAGYIYTHLTEPLLHATFRQKLWTIIPDGLFSRIPFDALPADRYGKNLIELKETSYQLSAKLFTEQLRGRVANVRPYTMSAFAPFADRGVSLSAFGTRKLERLPGSRAEINSLTGRVFFGEQATKRRFISEVANSSVIHLSTHAVVAGKTIDSIFLCFYPESNEEKTLLTVPEIYELRLSNARLIVLGACESANGALADLEGVLSLSRAFLYAGCGSTVSSLWTADDYSVADILHSFHHYLRAGLRKSDALRKAKLDFIHGPAVYKFPGFWANLQVLGDNSSISAPGFRVESIKLIPFAVAVLLLSALMFLPSFQTQKP